MFEWGDFLFAAGGASSDRAVAEVLQHPAAAQFVRISSAGAGGVDRGGLGDGDFSFACWRFNKAGCGRSPGSDDERAGLGLDTAPPPLKTTHTHANEQTAV